MGPDTLETCCVCNNTCEDDEIQQDKHNNWICIYCNVGAPDHAVSVILDETAGSEDR